MRISDWSSDVCSSDLNDASLNGAEFSEHLWSYDEIALMRSRVPKLPRPTGTILRCCEASEHLKVGRVAQNMSVCQCQVPSRGMRPRSSGRTASGSSPVSGAHNARRTGREGVYKYW